MTLLATGLVLFACQKERAEEDILVTDNHLTFTATIDGAGTRTSVDGTKISWNPAEEISIFYGASEGSKFVSQNTEPSQSVTFSGTLTAFTGTTEAGEPNSFWAIYPYDESNSSSGSSVMAYLPENQVGVPNNVPDKALMMVAKASGLALSFKQVCARIKVNVTTPGIRKIEIRGNNDETIAGSAVITMNSQGLPEWHDAGTGAGKMIELVPESGTTFEEAEYSIPIYPQMFSAGFTMTCYKVGEKGSYSTGAVTFGRNQVRSVNTNKVTEWTSSFPVPEVVDLGLPSGLKWASFNLGASKPEEYGDYYAWGDTEPYYSSLDPLMWKEGKEAGYSWQSYKWCMGKFNTMTKYCSDYTYGYNEFTDYKTVLDPEDDAAHVNLSDNWRMPTDAEWAELRDTCAWEWTAMNGIYGQKVTGPSGNSIFLPAAGRWSDTSLGDVGSAGHYWSSCTAVGEPSNKRSFFFSSDYAHESDGGPRGLSVRPVYGEFISVESVSLNKTSLTLSVGSTEQLTLIISPTNATAKAVTWESSNLSVAWGYDGVVEAKHAGTTTITAWASDGVHFATCNVTVKEAPSIPVPEAVDLGLPSGLKWASFNLGASSPEEYGIYYYAWGEVEPYYEDGCWYISSYWKEGKESGYCWSSYKWCNGSSNSLTKYCNDSSYGYNGFTDYKTILDPEDDAAHVNLGGNWRLPTDEEWRELIDNCTWTWTTYNGTIVQGMLVTASNGNSIFLPPAGYMSGTDVYSRGRSGSGVYLSSSQYLGDSEHAANPEWVWKMFFDSDELAMVVQPRDIGSIVRAVYAE